MIARHSLLVGFCFLLAFPIGVSAQGIVGGAGLSDWMPTITSLPGLNRIDWGAISIRPTVLAGYKHLGFNVSLGIPPTQILSPFGARFPEWGSLLDLYPLDVKVQSADLAVGAFRLDAQITPAWGLFGSVSANIPRTVSIYSDVSPGIGRIRPGGPLSWRGSRFQWSEFDVGGWYGINQAVGLVAGIRFDRVSVGFSNPDPVPSYRILIAALGFPTVYFSDYSGDLNTFFTIPYIGAQFFGPYFKGSVLIGSAGARLRLPLDLTHRGVYYALTILTGRRNLSEQAEYTFNKAGVFLEGNLEWSFPVRYFNCTVWAKGNWLRIRGNADVTTAGRSAFYFLPTPVVLPQPFSESSSGTSTLNQYNLDVGFSGVINF
jgi:hypothetical protein